MRRGAAALALALLITGCVDAAVWVEPPPPTRAEPPAPKPFRAESVPALEPTTYAKLFRAPSLSENLYYYEPDELWYRRWKGRWYQAFSWDGHWFPPKQVPQVLKDVAAAQRAATPEPP